MEGLVAGVRAIAAGVLVGMLLAVPGTARAQLGGGQVTGVVIDTAKAAVPGATVTAANAATGVKRSTVSTSAGAYTLTGLAPGRYTVSFELAGFRVLRRAGIHLETGETIR